MHSKLSRLFTLRNGGVTPLNIDTSTYFGMDDDIKDDEYMEEESNKGNEALIVASPTKDTEKKKVSWLLWKKRLKWFAKSLICMPMRIWA